MIKVFFTLLISGTMAWGVFSRWDHEVGEEQTSRDLKRRYLGADAIISVFFILLLFWILRKAGPQISFKLGLQFLFCILTTWTLYHGALLLLLPWLRQHISSRTCGLLWLLSGALLITQASYMSSAKPLLVLRVPEELVYGFFGLWLVGFALVLISQIVQHLVARRRLLKHARPVEDEQVLALYHDALREHNLPKAKIPLLIVPGLTTPMTMGLFSWSLRLLLPEKDYTPGDLNLIFRHEIVHILREDSWTKFYLTLTLALGWFNPLTWAAMKNSAMDMELSCDETVLLWADDDTRRRYAELILTTACEGRGFNTCLSASAKALRFRLKNILSDRRRSSGALILGLLFFVLCMASGHVGLSYGTQDGTTAIFRDMELSEVTLRHYDKYERAYNSQLIIPDEAAFIDYLSHLEVTNLTGNFTYSTDENDYTFLFDTPKGVLGLTLSDHRVHVSPLYDTGDGRTWYLPEGMDWNTFHTFVQEVPPMNVSLSVEKGNRTVRASLWQLVDLSTEEVLFQQDADYTPSGIFGHEFNPWFGSLQFPQEPTGPVSMTMYTGPYDAYGRLTLDSVTRREEVPLSDTLGFTPTVPGLYHVTTEYEWNGHVVSATYAFELGLT